MEEDQVIISVKGHRFVVSMVSLCERSDYFLMNYLYSDKNSDRHEIILDFVDVSSMELIIKYVQSSFNVNDLSEYTLPMIGKFAEAANLLQFIELLQIIESYLEYQEITTENWIEITNIAQNNNYAKLRQLCVECGVPPLKDMEPRYVPTMKDLLWYLSQTQLLVLNEYEVFKFGLDWMSFTKDDINPSTLLMILGCLDIKRVPTKDLIEIKTLCSTFVSNYNKSLAEEVVDCLIELSDSGPVTKVEIIAKESTINEKYSEQVYCEVLSLIECSRSRKIEYIPIVSMLKIERPPQVTTGTIFHNTTDLRAPLPSASTSDQSVSDPNWMLRPLLEKHDYLDTYNAGYNLYKFTAGGLVKWLDLKILIRRIDYFNNWNISTWGPRNLVLVISKCTTSFSSDSPLAIVSYATIKVYNVLKKKWTKYNTILPNVTVRKLAVVRDSLFIIGFEDNIIFDLKKSSHKIIAKLPYTKKQDTRVETRLPLTCVHNDEVYVSDLSSIHKYDVTNDEWVKVIDRHISNMVSNDDGYIYVTDVASNTVCRFRPDIDTTMDVVGKFDDDLHPIINACALGDRLVTFTNKGQRNLSIQEYITKSEAGGNLKEVWCQEHSEVQFDPYRSVCRLVIDEPSIDSHLTEYLNKYIRDR